MSRNLMNLMPVAGVLMVVAGSRCLGAAAATDRPGGASVQIHLPREAKVQEDHLYLGQISVVLGDAATAARASRIALGRLSMPGQSVVLDRPTILSRLASCGIPAEKVHLSGAQAVVVRRRQEIIDGRQFVEMAQQYLKRNPPVRSAHESIAVSKPNEMVLPDRAEGIQLVPQLVATRARGYVTVRIAVIAAGKGVGTRDIPFRLKYRCHKAVASADLAEGEEFTPENVRIEEISSDRPEPVGWRPPFGQVAARALPAGAEIRAEMIASAEPSVVIRRNETVVIRLERPGLVVTAVGIALQQAQTGEYVKIRNTDSHRVIVCRVNADGTVEPAI